MELGIGVDRADAPLDEGQVLRRDQIGLVEQDHVGEGDLLLRFRAVVEPLDQVLGVDDRHDGVELGLGAHVLIDEEGLRHGGGVGEPGGLDDDRVETAAPLHQPVDDVDEVAAHGAADAAVVHLEDFLVRADDEVVVDADLAELVDDHGVALPCGSERMRLSSVVLPAPR